MNPISQLAKQIHSVVNKGKTIAIFFRHGQTTANLSHQLCGWTDGRLSIRGREQANQLFPALYEVRQHIKSIYSSDLRRAKETAEIALGFPSENVIIEDRRLREINFGEHEGLAYEVLDDKIKEIVFTLQYQAPKGESWGLVNQRANNFIADKITPKSTNLIFSHGGLICTLTHQFGIVESISNCSCVCFEIDDKNKELKDLLFQWQFPQETEI